MFGYIYIKSLYHCAPQVPPLTLALAGRVLISWMRKVSGLTMMTRGMPVVCCTQHTRPGWFMTSDHWHRAGDILLLPPLELKRDGDLVSSSRYPFNLPDPVQRQVQVKRSYMVGKKCYPLTLMGKSLCTSLVLRLTVAAKDFPWL